MSILPDISTYLEGLYTGLATVYGFGYTDNGHGAKVLNASQTAVYTDIPCRLSYETKEPSAQDNFGNLEQEIVMFCDPSYTIAPGAKISITQAGITQDYECAGLRAMYLSHQEIRLTAHRKRA